MSSPIVSAARIMQMVREQDGDTLNHRHSRGRWERAHDCEGCRRVAAEYHRQRHIQARPERVRELEETAHLRCPCPSCQTGW